MTETQLRGCPTHPRYFGLKRPTRECWDCWLVRERYLQEELDEAKAAYRFACQTAVDHCSGTAALGRLNRMLASGEARRLRQASGLSAAQVARHCGVTHATMARWESGQVRARDKRALELLQLLDGLR